MNTKFDWQSVGEKMVYVKPVAVADLPSDVQEQAEGFDELFAVHNHEGERLALVADRKLAFSLARQHHMSPVTVH